MDESALFVVEACVGCWFGECELLCDSVGLLLFVEDVGAAVEIKAWFGEEEFGAFDAIC